MTIATIEPISKTSRGSASSPDSPSPLLDHYLGLRYKVELVEDEGAWVASNPDLPGCASFGPDPGTAVKNLADVRRLWLEGQIASGNKIPEPSGGEHYSGKFVLRIPKSLHRLAETRARSEGVSLNSLITNVLAGALDFGTLPASSEVKSEHTHECCWHRVFVSTESAHDWLTTATEPASESARRRGTSVFLDTIAGRLATHHRSVFDPSKEYWNAEDRRFAHK